MYYIFHTNFIYKNLHFVKTINLIAYVIIIEDIRDRLFVFVCFWIQVQRALRLDWLFLNQDIYFKQKFKPKKSIKVFTEDLITVIYYFFIIVMIT